MLQDIRDRTQGWLAWVVVILISIPFALWGIYEYLGGDPNLPVAKVNDVELNLTQFRQAYRRQQIHLRNLFGPNFDTGMLDEKTLRRNTLHELINEEVLIQSAIDSGLGIGDQQLAKAIQSRIIFHENGRFSEAAYQRWLRMFGYSAAGFEQEYRRSLLIDQIRSAIVDTALVSKQDVRNILRLEHQKRLIDLLTIPRARYLDNQITDDEIRKYYEENPSEFVTPERISVSYLELTPDDIADVPEPTEQELRALYENRGTEYVKIDDESDVERSFEEVRDELSQVFQRHQKEQQFFDKAEELANLTFENPDTLEVAADILGLTIKETGFFDRTGSGDGDTSHEELSSNQAAEEKSPEGTAITKEQKFIFAAFSEDVLDAENNSEPIELGEYHVVVLRRKDYQPISPQPLDAVRDQIATFLDIRAAQKRVIDMGEELTTQLRGEATLASVAKTHELTLRDQIEVGRQDTNEAYEIIDRVFRMPHPKEGKTTYDGMVASTGDFVVIALHKITESIPTDENSVLKTRNALTRTYGDEEYQAYIHALREEAEIELYEDNL